MSEPIKEKQVGSSAMPHKKNPITSERICSLTRYVATLPKVSWENAAQSIFERTLDDSANRRIIIPEAFLAIDESLNLYQNVLEGLEVYPEGVERSLENYGPFAGTEAVVMKLVEEGEDRQEMHERIREISSKAWKKVMKGEENPLVELLEEDEIVGSKLTKEEIEDLLSPSRNTGDVSKRCEEFLDETIEPILSKYEGWKLEK